MLGKSSAAVAGLILSIANVLATLVVTILVILVGVYVLELFLRSYVITVSVVTGSVTAV